MSEFDCASVGKLCSVGAGVIVGNFTSKLTHIRTTSNTKSRIDDSIVGVLVSSVTATRTSFHENNELLGVPGGALDAICSAADGWLQSS